MKSLNDLMSGIRTEKVGNEWRAIRKSNDEIVFRMAAPLGEFLDALYRHLRPDLYQYTGTPWAHVIGRKI